MQLENNLLTFNPRKTQYDQIYANYTDCPISD